MLRKVSLTDIKEIKILVPNPIANPIAAPIMALTKPF